MEEGFEYQPYWYLNEKSAALCIDNLDFIAHLHKDLGYCHVVVNGIRSLGRINNNIVDIVEDKTYVINSELKWLDDSFGTKIDEDIYTDSLKGKLLNKAQFLL